MANKAGSTVDALIQDQREFERLFLAGIIAYGDIARFAWVSPDLFTGVAYREYWETILAKHLGNPGGKDGAQDAIELALTSGIYNELSGATRDIDPFTQQAAASKLREYSHLREIMAAITEIAKEISSSHDIVAVRRRIDALSEINPPEMKEGKKPSDVHLEFKRILDGEKSSIVYGIPSLDKLVGGMFGGEITILASRPGVGKTAFVLQVIRQVCWSGKKVAFFSQEMSSEQVWARMACPSAKLSWVEVRAGNITPADKARLEEVSLSMADRLEDTLTIFDRPMTPEEMYMLMSNGDYDLCVIDQLPDIVKSDSKVDDVAWLGDTTKYLRTAIARGLSVPVLLVHQISRSAEASENKKPSMSHLRGSGALEQRADVVITLHRRDMYDSEDTVPDIVPVDLSVLKNRQGKIGRDLLLGYNLIAQWFTDES